MCCECIKKIRWGKVIWAGLVFLVIGFVVRQVEAVLTMNYYLMPEYFGVWSKVMMPSVGPPPASFMIISAIFIFLTGVVLAGFYDFIKELLPKKPGERVVCFMVTMISLLVVFFTLPVYLMFNVPVGLLVSWFLSTLVVLGGASVVFGKILR